MMKRMMDDSCTESESRQRLIGETRRIASRWRVCFRIRDGVAFVGSSSSSLCV